MKFGLILHNLPPVVLNAPAGSKMLTSFPQFGVQMEDGKFLEIEGVYRLAKKGQRGFSLTENIEGYVGPVYHFHGLLGCNVTEGWNK
jgi:hypothetical protein